MSREFNVVIEQDEDGLLTSDRRPLLQNWPPLVNGFDSPGRSG